MSLLAQPVLAKSSNFYEKVVEVCIKHQCSITSWVRSPKHNAAVGGVPNSKHLTGQAVDAIVDGNYKAFIEDARSLGLKVIRESDHVHLENIDAIGINNSPRVNTDRRAPQTLGHEPEGQGGERPANSTSSEREGSPLERGERNKEQRGAVHTQDYSNTVHFSDYSVAQIRATVGHKHRSWLDGVPSGLSVDGWYECSGVEDSTGSSPNTPRHPFSICDSRSIFRWKYSRV